SSSSDPGDIIVSGGRTAISWSSKKMVTPDARHGVQINSLITPTGSGTLAVTYDDGGTGGRFLAGSGDLSFGSSAKLTINSTPFTLVTNAAGLQTVTSSGDYALADNIGLTGTLTGPLVSGTYTGTFEGLGNSISGLTI